MSDPKSSRLDEDSAGGRVEFLVEAGTARLKPSGVMRRHPSFGRRPCSSKGPAGNYGTLISTVSPALTSVLGHFKNAV